MSFTQEQMKQMTRGIRAGIDITLYKNPELSPEQMKQVRLGLQNGVDVTKFNMPYIKSELMEELRKALESGVKTSVFDIRDGMNYNAAQAREIRLGLENEQKIELYANPDFSAAQMREIRLGQKDGLNADLYATRDFTVEQMKSLRVELIIQKFIETIKEKFAELWQAITKWAERFFMPHDFSEENATMAEETKEVIISNKISEAFIEVYGAMSKLSEAVEDITAKSDEEYSEFEEAPYDERVNAFLDEIHRQMGTEQSAAQECESIEDIEA